VDPAVTAGNPSSVAIVQYLELFDEMKHKSPLSFYPSMCEKMSLVTSKMQVGKIQRKLTLNKA
jgi:hypothetical protein